MIGERQLGRMPHRGLGRVGAHLLDQGTELLEDVVDGLDELGPVADQGMAAPAVEAIHRAGYREDLTVLLDRVPGGRQRSAPRRRLHHDDAQAQTGDDPVPLSEQASQWDLPHRHLAVQSAGLGQGAGQVLVLGRIDRGQPVGHHGDAAAPGLDRPAVGRGIDSAPAPR